MKLFTENRIQLNVKLYGRNHCIFFLAVITKIYEHLGKITDVLLHQEEFYPHLDLSFGDCLKHPRKVTELRNLLKLEKSV